MQALAVADNVAFQNCLIAMHPRTLKAELPSTWDVSVCLHNETKKWLKKMKSDIEVSLNLKWPKNHSPQQLGGPRKDFNHS